jgi:hypothetical protein
VKSIAYIIFVVYFFEFILCVLCGKKELTAERKREKAQRAQRE